MVIMIPILVFITIAFAAAKKLKLNPKRSSLIEKIIVGKIDIDSLSNDDKAEYEAIKEELF